MRVNARTLCVITGIVLVANGHAQDNEIFRCTLPDGSVSFQGMPCADPTEPPAEPDPPANKVSKPDDDFFDFDNPFDDPTPDEQQVEEDKQTPSANRADCEKRTRAAIDSIDASLAKLPPADETKAALAELLRLTRQLRECKSR